MEAREPMKCVLTTEIRVFRVAVFCEMAWMERRPELGLLCRAAQQQGNWITTAVVQSALPGLHDAGARNVIAWCVMLDLCDESGGLTSLGEEVAETDEAPVPEQGVYGLWLAQHPIIGQRVLAAERLASNRDARYESIDPLPVYPDLGKLFCSVLDGKERFLVRDLPTNHGQPGCLSKDTHATCRLHWTLDFDQEASYWQIDGTIDVPTGNSKHAMRPMQHEPEPDDIDLWKVAEAWARGPLSTFGRWHPKERRLAVAIEGLSESEIAGFQKTFVLRRVEIPGKGGYENVTLEGVPVGPVSADDAQKWAMRLFERDLADSPSYRSRAEVRTRFADLTEDTPLEDFGVTLPAHDELLRKAAEDRARFWALAAAVDLSPFPTSPEELGVLRIGTPVAKVQSASSTEPNHVVRVPYRAAGWSMRRLVERLLAGTVPHRVLLADRYVRGSENLATLKLLVSALRALAPKVVIDIWTDDEDADFKAVQTITGTAPRSYRETFGRNAPHARYFLVLPVQGSGFGWQMDNSPIDARGGESTTHDQPLRWRDFSANRVSSGELQPELRQWLVGGGR